MSVTLIDEVRTVIHRLAPRGWKHLMKAHGLVLDAADLATELRRPLIDVAGKSTIDRKLAGFEDLSPNGASAIRTRRSGVQSSLPRPCQS